MVGFGQLIVFVVALVLVLNVYKGEGDKRSAAVLQNRER